MIIKQLSVFLENKSGRLTEVTEALASAQINISAFSIADTSDFGVLRMIVNKPDAAQQILNSRGVAVHITEVVGLVVPDEPGGLHRTLQILSSEGVSVEYMYAFALNNRATVILRTDAIQQTVEILQKHKLELLKSSDIYEV
ncbi:MAG: acetolactate synthase [Ignavibacteriae bacterium]|nr:MAG: acetolactate synthase [Ignavibacteriota bacterium]